MNSRIDSIYAEPLKTINGFTFDETVVRVFPDMIVRSVPGYQTIISAIGLLARHYALPGSNCYDLGCSLGAATFSMAAQIEASDCKIIAVDSSAAMIVELEQRLKKSDFATPVILKCADIRDITIENATVVVLNFTLQFIPTADRLNLLQRIYQGMKPGGILVLSEKLQFPDPKQEELHTKMHHLFKKANGYSDLEISQKRTALENVLVPETLALHKNRLAEAGFSSAEVWFQYFNFASLIALK